jgi:tetratricopeptide (TPR) repeat protein
MKITKPSIRYYPFPLFVTQLIGEYYRSFSLTIRFKDFLTAEFATKFLPKRPLFLRGSTIILDGRELTVTIGKIASEMARDDFDAMELKVTNKDRRTHEDAFDYIFYIPGFQTRKKFDNDVDAWLLAVHLKYPIQFVIRDETDLSRSRYPGAEWCNLSDHFVLWDQKSVDETNILMEDLQKDPATMLLEGDEQKIFRYSIKAISYPIEKLRLPYDNRWERFIVSKSILETWLCEDDRKTLSEVFQKNSTGRFTDITLYSDVGEIIHSHFGPPGLEEKIKQDTVLWIASEIYPYKDAWEIAFGDGYRLSLILHMAIENNRPEMVEKIRTFAVQLEVWVAKFMYWFYQIAHYFLTSKKIAEAFKIFELILSFDFMHDRYVNHDLIAVFPNALFCITERNTGMKASDEIIDHFLARCLLHADKCAAIYEKAALLYIQRKQYDKALDAYIKTFTTPKVEWPLKNVTINNSAYCNALWLVLKGNSNLDVDTKIVKMFIKVAHEFADVNPAIHTNLTLVYAQLRDFEKAKEQFLLSQEKDHENFSLLKSEIDSLPSMQDFKIYLTAGT